MMSTKNKVSHWYYFFFTLAVHIYIMMRYNTIENTGMFILSYILTFLFVVGFYVFWHARDPGEVRNALIATFGGLLIYVIPMLIKEYVRLSPSVENSIYFLVMFIPIWPLFMANKIDRETNSKVFHVFFTIWKLILVFLVLLTVWGFLRSWGVSALGGVDVGSPVDVMAGAKEFLSDSWEKTKLLFSGTAGVFKRATDPQSYYKGQVEEGENIPLGVEITSLRAADERVSNESPILVFGTVRARPIKSQEYLGEDVTVRPGCVMKQKTATAAAVDPVEMPIVWGTFGQFECEFPAVGRRGSYTITATAAFPFQTWAYVEYTFIDDELARNIARQGLDVQQELDIKPNTAATYTNGPVILGMGGTPQPIRVQEDGTLPEGTRVGITLDSNWVRGKVQHVDQLEIKVPQPFTLTECSRTPEREFGEVDQKDPSYTSWTFKNPDIDPVSLYGSVTCKLVLNDRTEAQKIAQQEKAVRTIVGTAYYTYAVEEKTTVQVR